MTKVSTDGLHGFSRLFQGTLNAPAPPCLEFSSWEQAAAYLHAFGLRDEFVIRAATLDRGWVVKRRDRRNLYYGLLQAAERNKMTLIAADGSKRGRATAWGFVTSDGTFRINRSNRNFTSAELEMKAVREAVEYASSNNLSAMIFTDQNHLIGDSNSTYSPDADIAKGMHAASERIIISSLKSHMPNGGSKKLPHYLHDLIDDVLHENEEGITRKWELFTSGHVNSGVVFESKNITVNLC